MDFSKNISIFAFAISSFVFLFAALNFPLNRDGNTADSFFAVTGPVTCTRSYSSCVADCVNAFRRAEQSYWDARNQCQLNAGDEWQRRIDRCLDLADSHIQPVLRFLRLAPHRRSGIGCHNEGFAEYQQALNRCETNFDKAQAAAQTDYNSCAKGCSQNCPIKG